MWREIEVEAILVLGLNYDYFWSITPKIYERFRTAHIDQEKQKVRQADMLNHLLGRYISFGVNDPTKYPTKPFLSSDQFNEPEEMTDEEMERQAKRNTIRMGGITK